MTVEPVRCPHGVIVAYHVRDASPTDPLPTIHDWCPSCRLGAGTEKETTWT